METPNDLRAAHPLYGTLRGIVEHHQFARVKSNGKRVLIDAMTASVAWKIVNAVNEQNALKYLNLFDADAAKWARVTWQMVQS